MWTQECLCLCDTGQRRSRSGTERQEGCSHPPLLCCIAYVCICICVCVFVFAFAYLCDTGQGRRSGTQRQEGMSPPLHVPCRIASFRLGRVLHVMLGPVPYVMVLGKIGKKAGLILRPLPHCVFWARPCPSYDCARELFEALNCDI